MRYQRYSFQSVKRYIREKFNKHMPTINKPKSKRRTDRRVFRQKYYQMKEWRYLTRRTCSPQSQSVQPQFI